MNQSPLEPAAEAPDTSRRVRFALVHVVYVVTLLASSLATFGGSGLWPGIFICGFWASIFTSRSRPRAFVTACLAAVLGLCLLSLSLPAFSRARGASRRMQCQNNLKQIGLALHNYHDVYRSFPPAYVADANGKPMHSWRVLILPFVEQGPLYDAYDFDEPWNGPHNAKLLKQMPRVYACPSFADHSRGAEAATGTSYVAVVGPGTAWPGAATSKFSEIRDGSTSTVLIVEAGARQIPWLEPRDLDYDQAIQQFVDGDPFVMGAHQHEDFFYRYSYGRNVAFADARVAFIPLGVSATVWQAMLGKDDGIAWDDDDIDVPSVGARRLKVGNCLRLGLFVVLTLFPLPWVWLNPTSGRWPSNASPPDRAVDDVEKVE